MGRERWGVGVGAGRFARIKRMERKKKKQEKKERKRKKKEKKKKRACLVQFHAGDKRLLMFVCHKQVLGLWVVGD